MEHGCKVTCAGFPSFLSSVSEDSNVPTLWVLGLMPSKLVKHVGTARNTPLAIEGKSKVGIKPGTLNGQPLRPPPRPRQ